MSLVFNIWCIKIGHIDVAPNQFLVFVYLMIWQDLKEPDDVCLTFLRLCMLRALCAINIFLSLPTKKIRSSMMCFLQIKIWISLIKFTHCHHICQTLMIHNASIICVMLCGNMSMVRYGIMIHNICSILIFGSFLKF